MSICCHCTRGALYGVFLAAYASCSVIDSPDVGSPADICDAALEDCNVEEDAGLSECEGIVQKYACEVDNTMRCKGSCQSDEDCVYFNYGVNCQQADIAIHVCGNAINRAEIDGIQESMERHGDDTCSNVDLRCISMASCAYSRAECVQGSCVPVFP